MDATQRVQTQAVRVSRAPFICLLLLNLLYAGAGVILTATALLAVVGGRGTMTGSQHGRVRGVRDAQVRLSVPAIVAESFGSPALGDDGMSMDDLFVERQGKKTRRVAPVEGKMGGRRYQQVFDLGKREGELENGSRSESEPMVQK